MKTRIVSTRIPTGQANGAFNIKLPTDFKYSFDNISAKVWNEFITIKVDIL